MDSRLEREKTFHNRLFGNAESGHDAREGASKFYAVSQSCFGAYHRFLESHCAGMRVLEYGCGRGSYAYFLARHGAQVTGIDLSDVAIHQARTRASDEGLDIDFQVMNAETLEFGDNSFDLICGAAILHHLDLHKALSELARVLRPHGSAVFMEPLGINPLFTLYRRLTPRMRTVDEHPFNRKDLRLPRKYFGQVDISYFTLQSLLAVPFRNRRVFTPMLKGLDAADRALFRFVPFAKQYAWQMVLVFSKPVKECSEPTDFQPSVSALTEAR